MKDKMKGKDSDQRKPVGDKPKVCVKESVAYTKSYSKGKQNLKK